MQPAGREDVERLAAIEALLQRTRRVTSAHPDTVARSLRRGMRALLRPAERLGLDPLSRSIHGLLAGADDKLVVGLDALLEDLGTYRARVSQTRDTILLAQGHDGMARLMQVILEGPDRRFVLATSVRSARDALRREQVALLVLDLELPDADGRELLVDLADDGAPGLQTIVCAARDEVSPTECYALGADVVLEKPVAPDLLAATVAARLRASHLPGTFRSRP